MAKYCKKPVVVEATQWFKLGDHPIVSAMPLGFVRNQCNSCGKYLSEHGNCPTLEGHHIVCPGDWIITGVKGEHYPCKPDIFEATYDKVATVD